MRANHAGITGAGATANVPNAFADTTAIAAVTSGKRKTLYGSIMYHFDKTTELYFAADKLSLTEGYRVKALAGALEQTEFGVGLRLRC